MKSANKIVWNLCNSSNKLAERFYIPGFDGYLPFLLREEDCRDSKKIILSEKHLLFGILCSIHEYDDPNMSPYIRPKDKQTIYHLLDILGNGFNLKNPEKLVLDVAFKLRAENDLERSTRVLLNGMFLIPDSSKIKSDFIMAFWELSVNDSFINEELLKVLDKQLPLISIEDVLPAAYQAAIYFAFSLHKIHGDNVDKLVDDYLIRYVCDKGLKRKIADLIDKQKITFEDCISPPGTF